MRQVNCISIDSGTKLLPKSVDWILENIIQWKDDKFGDVICKILAIMFGVKNRAASGALPWSVRSISIWLVWKIVARSIAQKAGTVCSCFDSVSAFKKKKLCVCKEHHDRLSNASEKNEVILVITFTVKDTRCSTTDMTSDNHPQQFTYDLLHNPTDRHTTLQHTTEPHGCVRLSVVLQGCVYFGQVVRPEMIRRDTCPFLAQYDMPTNMR